MNTDNLLERIPCRCAREVARREGRARVEFTRFRSGAGRLFGRFFRASETIKLTLDEKSTAVWDLIDGRTDVRHIADEMGKRYGQDIEPLYDRLAELLAILEKNRLIRY